MFSDRDDARGKRRREKERFDPRKIHCVDVPDSWPGSRAVSVSNRSQYAQDIRVSTNGSDPSSSLYAGPSRMPGGQKAFNKKSVAPSRRTAAPSSVTHSTTNAPSSDDEIQMTGWRPATRHTAAFGLPSSSTISKPSIQPIVISSDDDESAGSPMQRVSRKFVSRPKRKHSDATPSVKHASPRNNFSFGNTFTTVHSVQPPRKLVKTSTNTKLNAILIDDSSNEDGLTSDSDYDNFHEGYHLGWSTIPPGLEQGLFEEEIVDVQDAVEKLSLDRAKLNVTCSSRRLSPWPSYGLSPFHTSTFRYKGPSSFRPLTRPTLCGPIQSSYNGGRCRTGLLRHQTALTQSPLTKMKLCTTFLMADACQTISQCPGKILVASATPGGIMDEFGEFTVDPYNARETLATWTEGQNQTYIPAHYINSNDPGGIGGPFQRKYYDVRCARFDPQNLNIFVSTGLDGVLTVWTWEPQSLKFGLSSACGTPRPVKRWGKETYNSHSCHDIVYRPPMLLGDRTLFSASCDNGTVFVHSYTSQYDPFEQPSHFSTRGLRVADHVSLKVGTTVWGCGLTSSELFVCSEADEDSLAFHGAFDFETGKLIYHFDDHRSGEGLALDPAGDTLALFTAEKDPFHLHLRLYDVRRQSKRNRAALRLPPASSRLSEEVWPEVRTAEWSPDGILLAVGKNDDVAHIYDVRCLERGPLLTLTHDTPHASHYGITVLAWTVDTRFKSPHLGLVTGGGDHCIALWDVKTACRNRTVLAELQGQVGVGHLGDLSKGEKPLVVGDTDGHVYVYDFVCKSTDY